MVARRILLLIWLTASLVTAVVPETAAQPVEASASAGSDADEHAARIAERYKAMLAANPVEGMALDRLWKSYEDRGFTGNLLDQYRQASQHPPTGKEGTVSSLVYGHLLKKAGRLDEAAAAYRQAGSVDAGNPLPLLALADLAVGRGKPVEAAGFYEQALGKLPAGDARRSDLLLKLGAAWLAAGQPLKAAERWEATVALDPGNLSLHRELAANYERSHLPERAIAHYETIEQHGSPAERAQALRDLGRLHQARDEFDAARDAFERGLTLTSRENWLHGDLEGQLIRLHQRAGRTAELEARWQAAVAENPRDVGGYLRLEHLAEAQTDVAGERAALQKIVALVPRDRESTLKLARLLADAGEREPAAALYDQMLKLQPENLELLLARADLDLQLGRPSVAVERIEARVARTPADESVASPALAFFLSRHLDEAAERLLRQDASRQSAPDESVLALAKFLSTQRKLAEARATLESFAARPGDPAVRAARWLRVADLYREQNAPEDALRCWRLASELQPDLLAPLLATGDLLLARGDATGACAVLQRAVDAAPAGPERIETERKLFQAMQTGDSPAAGEKTGAFPLPVRVARRAAVPGVVPGTSHNVAAPGSSPPPDPRALLDVAHASGNFTAAPFIAPELVSVPLARYLDQLEETVKSQPTAANYVRLARWLYWSHDLPAAAASAEDAARLDPRDLPARELLSTLALDAHQRVEAERWLREIMAIDPGRQAACLKQIANLKLDAGDTEAALATFVEIQHAAPGSVAALTDLALARQRADHWFDALAAWEQAYALPGATQAQRAEIRRPLLTALEKLDRIPRAAEVLQSAIDEQADIDSKQDLFRELIAFSRQHGLADALRQDYEARLNAQPQDYFLLTALAELRRAAGHEHEAYRLLGQAYYSAPDPVRSLRTLVEAAESLGAIDEAVVHQRRLAALPGQATLETLEKLASLEDSSSQADTAVRTWENIVARFPRDPLALGHAANFFEADGKTGRSRELLDQLVRLHAADNKQLLRLGELNAAAADIAGARIAFEQLLTRSEPEGPGSPLILPGGLDKLPPLDNEADTGETTVSRRAFRTVPAGGSPALAIPPSEDSDARLRLRAIGGISRLLFPAKSSGMTADPAVQQAWLARWREAEKAGARSEPLQAFYQANGKGLVMDCLERWLDKTPADVQLHKAILVSGLRLGEYRRLATWIWSPDERGGGLRVRSRELVQSLAQWLTGPDIDAGPNLVADLFPPGVKARDALWLAASNVFAARQRYAEAVELGERLFATASADYLTAYGQELAHWQLYLGHTDRARTILRRVLAENEGDTLGASGGGLFALLREYYLLLPPGERRPFTEEYLAWTRQHSSAAYAVLCGVLLHGLGGDETAARHDLDTLLGMRLLTAKVEDSNLSSDARRWDYLTANGWQLHEWNLTPLSIYLWRQALGGATGFDRQSGDSQQKVVELRNLLLLEEVETAATPQFAREYVENYLRTRPPIAEAAALASQWVSNSRFGEAARVDEYLCELEPDQADHWLERFAALKAAGDPAAAARLFRGVLENKAHFPANLGRLQVVQQLAELLENDLADAPGARRWLWRERKAGKSLDHSPLAWLARSYERAGQWENAARVWREIPDDPTGNAALNAGRIEAQYLGRSDEALSLVKSAVERNSPPGEHSRAIVTLAGLQIAAGRTDEAAELGFGLLHDAQSDGVARVATLLAAHGQPIAARQLLTASLRRTHDPRIRLQQQRALVEVVAAAPGDDAIFERELRRLKTIADGAASSGPVFDDVRFDLARRRHMEGWLEGELTRDWCDGRGRIAAGEDLACLYLDTHREERLTVVIGQILKHPSAGETMLTKLQKSLADGGRNTLAASVSKVLYQNYPQKDAYGLTYARDLWNDKRRDEAHRVFTTLAAAGMVRENICARIGGICLELGDRTMSQEFLEQAIAADPTAAHTPGAWLQLANLNLESGRLAEVRQELRAAYRDPACVDMKPLTHYLCATVAAGTENQPRLGGREFPLTAVQRGRLLPLIVDSLEAAGRGDDARGVITAHPEWLVLAPSVVRILREKLTPGDADAWARLASLIDGAMAQADPPCVTLNREAAAFYVAWADQEAASPDGHPTPEAALAHLVRAHALDPESFPIANRLARLQMERRQDAAAVETLRGFLSVDALPEEHADAARTLHKG